MPAGRVTRRKDKLDQTGFFILYVYYSYKIYFDHIFIRCETKTFSVNYFSQHLTSGLCKNQGLTHLFSLLLYKLIEQKKLPWPTHFNCRHNLKKKIFIRASNIISSLIKPTKNGIKKLPEYPWVISHHQGQKSLRGLEESACNFKNH